MLILSRKLGESVVLSAGVRITVIDIRGSRLRLGIDAPAEVVILRQEVAERLPAEALTLSSRCLSNSAAG